MSPDKQAIAEKICSVLEKLINIIKSEIIDKWDESEVGKEEDFLDMGVPAKKATVVVVKKEKPSMTDMLKGF